MKSVRVVKDVWNFVTEEIDNPALPTGAVRVRIKAAFLPPFFQHLPGGGWGTPPRPFTPGQCAIGVVEELDASITGLRVGQLVYCDTYIEGPGDEADHGFIGCFGVGGGAARHLVNWPNGTFAEEFVGPEHCFTPIPQGVDAAPEILCRLGWFATALAGFERGGFRPGMTLAINGAAGMLGTAAALVAVAIGAANVRLVGRRKDVLAELATLNPRITVETDDDATPLDFVLDCAGGEDTGPTINLTERLRRRGVITFVGALAERAPVDTSLLMRNGNSMVGSFWFPHYMARDVLDLIASGAIDLSALRAECFGLDDIEAAMKHSVEKSGGLSHVALKP